MEVLPTGIREPEDIDRAFARVTRERVHGLIVIASPVTVTHRAQIIRLAAKYRVPAVYGDELFAYDGGLMSYWTSIVDMHYLAARQIDKILRGAKPANLPVEYPTRFRLVLNLQTAKALGLKVPDSVLLQADEIVK